MLRRIKLVLKLRKRKKEKEVCDTARQELFVHLTGGSLRGCHQISTARPKGIDILVSQDKSSKKICITCETHALDLSITTILDEGNHCVHVLDGSSGGISIDNVSYSAMEAGRRQLLERINRLVQEVTVGAE